MSSDRDLSYEILRSLRRILRQVSERSRRLRREAGLTVPQLLCLQAIASAAPGEERTVADVARRVHLSAATVSRILDRLEHADYIARERTSEDRRKVCLRTTEKGRARLADVPTPLQEEFLQRLKALPESERRELFSALERIVTMMEAQTLDAAPLLTPEAEVQRSPAAASRRRKKEPRGSRRRH
jgi:DNA-binding MarR family transcriptional regulator